LRGAKSTLEQLLSGPSSSFKVNFDEQEDEAEEESEQEEEKETAEVKMAVFNRQRCMNFQQ
jgi:hypothetical protein